jgi:hypothetical protein
MEPGEIRSQLSVQGDERPFKSGLAWGIILIAFIVKEVAYQVLLLGGFSWQMSIGLDLLICPFEETFPLDLPPLASARNSPALSGKIGLMKVQQKGFSVFSHRMEDILYLVCAAACSFAV